MRLRVLSACALTLIVCTASAQDIAKPATYESVELSGGFARDPYSIRVEAGGSVDASKLGGGCTGMIADAPDVQLEFTPGRQPLYLSVASDVDTTLVVNTPDGEWVCDDDSGTDLNAALRLANPQEGTYDIWVGVLDRSDTPTASLHISGQRFFDTAAPAVATRSDGTRTERGRLQRGDGTLSTGEYRDIYRFNGNSGARFVIDLRSSEFDPYLIVRAPSGKQFDNDDFEGSASRSLVSLTLEEAGEHQVTVTSYKKDEIGAYTLTIAPQSTQTPPVTQYDGTLASSDRRLGTGQYVDTYEFEGAPGRIMIDLTSTAFDTYLKLVSPSGAVTENDDADSTSHSLIETDLTDTGTYKVQVTSYERSGTGGYHLKIERRGPLTTAQQSARDITNLTFGQAASGRLADGDSRPDRSKYQDYYAFTGTVGQTIRVDLASSDFDTYLIVRTPSGREITNDDFGDDTSRSVVDVPVTEAGRHQVIVTSYEASETGAYRVTASLANATVAAQAAPRNTVATGGRVYGIFVGVSNYGGRASNLSFTADDPVNVRDALIRGAGMDAANTITLTDSRATTTNLRQAFRDLSSKVRPNDTFVFFFSGHGDRRPRAGGPEAADADGLDETIELYDAAISDNDFASLLDQIGTARSIVILDSCFSGGFAKDIVSKPGRMGLFSSDEDVTSLVAAKFQAGGYLSLFFKEAVAEARADANRDRSIDALELSQYLHERYRNEAQEKSPTYVSAPGFGYQHLVVDRGGVAPYEVLFSTR